MGIKFGEIDVGQILENEFRINVLERIVEFHAAHSRYPDINELGQIRENVAELLKKKYPESGIKLQK